MSENVAIDDAPGGAGTTAAKAPATAGVIVPTHNDVTNIGALLQRLLDDPAVAEIFVIASACTDGTAEIAEAIAASSGGRIRLVVEATRSGKAAAVNVGLAALDRPHVVIVSGDVLPAPGAIGLMVDALRRPGVGLAGGRPLPLNDEATFAGYAVHMLWRLHHRIAMGSPKIGEAIAMRREAAVPLPRTSVDEPCFQALLQSAGWQPAYVPEAIISNWGPRTARDFVRQRRQVHTGNIWLNRRLDYRVPSLNPVFLLKELGRDLLDDRDKLSARTVAWAAGTMAMEVFARAGARVNVLRGKEECVWAMIETAKAPPGGRPHDGVTTDEPAAAAILLDA